MTISRKMSIQLMTIPCLDQTARKCKKQMVKTQEVWKKFLQILAPIEMLDIMPGPLIMDQGKSNRSLLYQEDTIHIKIARLINVQPSALNVSE